MAVTMNEIAKRLNISIATVSRALSGQADSVSEETRRAIFDAVEKFGYKKRRSIGKSVAFVIDKGSFDLSAQFYAAADFARAIQSSISPKETKEMPLRPIRKPTCSRKNSGIAVCRRGFREISGTGVTIT